MPCLGTSTTATPTVSTSPTFGRCCRSATSTVCSRAPPGRSSSTSTKPPRLANGPALAAIFLGRAGGTVAHLYGPAIGDVHVERSAHVTLEHTAARKRIDVVGYLRVEAEGAASEPGDVQCGIPGFDHPGTELHGDALRSTDPALRWEIKRRRHAAFTTDFDHRSDA